MLNFRKALVVFGVFVFAMTLGYATPASAQASRTWVSGVGDDVNPCSRTAPCKTFAGAISKTAAGGEINCLDPAGFGAVTITKSITIDCTGTLGGILSSSTTGILVNGAGANVVLRGLSINGGPPNIPGLFGVRFIQGNSLTIVDSIIENILGASPNGIGVSFTPSGTATLSIVNTTIINCASHGIRIQPSVAGASVRAILRDVRVLNNGGDGLRLDTTGQSAVPGLFVTIDHSDFSGNVNGIHVFTPAATSLATVIMANSNIANNSGTGLFGDGSTARARVGSNTITNNGTGTQSAGGAEMRSYGDNRLGANTVDGTFFGVSPLPTS